MKLLRLLTSHEARFEFLVNRGFYNKMADEAYLKYRYYVKMKRKLRLDQPKTFNEKLQWLKLNDRNPRYTTMVDKYAVKQYVSELIGKEYVIPTLGVWDSFDEIEFDSLPDRFVLKCTHDSGGVVICKNKESFDYAKARKKITKSLKRNYYYPGREWPYKGITPRIIAEQFLEDSKMSALCDYKFFCFHGEPRVILLCAERYSAGGLRENFYDTEWNLLDVQRPKHPNTDYSLEKPEKLPEMLDVARALSKDVPFLRIDLYVVDNKIYFGEFTFFPASGFAGFEPKEWDNTFGSWIDLPKK